MKRDITPGPWQEEINPFGGVRRYRMIGNCKEYEPTIRVDGIEIPQSELAAFNERKERARREAEERANYAQQQQRTCPFSKALDPVCLGDKCAMFASGGCTLSRIAAASRKTAGLRCPFNPYPCRESCALYKGGCTYAAERISL